MVVCAGQAVFANIFSTFFKFSHLKSFNNPTQSKYVVFYLTYAFKLFITPTIYIHFIPFILLCVSRLFIIKETGRLYSPLYKLGLLLGSLLFMITPVIILNSNLENTIYNSSVSGSYGAHSTGLYNYLLYDFIDYMADKQPPITDKQKQEVKAYLAELEKANYQNPISGKDASITNEYTGIASGKNLILIQLEAFNQFLINLEVEGEEVTPNLNRLYNNSLAFNHFYSSSGIGNTSDAEFSALTGLYANGNDLTIFDFAKDSYHTLTKDFKAQGYDTMSFHGNIGGFYRREVEHLRTLGFDMHYDLNYFQALNPDAPCIHGYLDDQYFMPEVAKMLSEYDKFFGLAITVTSHSPYVPDKQIEHIEYDGLTSLANNYLDFARHTDEAIGMFIDTMEEYGLLEDTVILLYGDHTSSLFIQDLESIFNKTFSEADYRRAMQNVPLIIYNEELFSPQINHKVGGTVDIYRTMANLFGLDIKYRFANDLLSDEPGFVYNPRNLDIIIDDAIIFYPNGKVFSDKAIDGKFYIEYFENYKYRNDLLLIYDFKEDS